MSQYWSLPRWIKVVVLLLVLALPLAANAAPVRQPNVDAVVSLPIGQWRPSGRRSSRVALL
jgi:hypothetical protein